MTAGRRHARRVVALGTAVLVLTVVAAVNVLVAAAQPQVLPIVAEPLTPRSVFTDGVDLKFKLKADDGSTTVANVEDPSRTVVVRYTVQPGAQFPWHSHRGPVVVNIMTGALTYVDADTCSERTYASGQAFVDPGQGHVHSAFNPSATDVTTFIATFYAAPAVPEPLLILADPAPSC